MSNTPCGSTKSRFAKKNAGDSDDGQETEGDVPDEETIPPPKFPLSIRYKNALGGAILLTRERWLE